MVWSLLEYKPTWTLTPLGWLVLWALFSLLGLIFVTRIQPFLACNKPVEAEYLIVEGWITDEAMIGAIAEFHSRNYKKIITTGIKIPRGYHLAEYKDFATFGAANLIALGFPPENVIATPADSFETHRTTAAAEAFRDWLIETDLKVKGINVYSLDVHTRRSWLIYKKVLGEMVKVGAIASPAVYYQPARWWENSIGVRSVISELIAYVYAKIVKLI